MGTFGDVSIFSIRKILPIPDGGVLLINRRDIPLPKVLPPPPLRVTMGMLQLKIARNLETQQGQIGRVIKRSITGPSFRLWRKLRCWRQSSSSFVGDPLRLRTDRIGWGITTLSEKLIRTTDIESVIRRRRKNFKHLLANVKASEHIEPLFDRLPEGVCPFAFPVLVKEPKAFDQYLTSCGIEAARSYSYFHPDFPKEQFPQETFLKEHIRMLPVHQQIDGASIISMVNVLNVWRGPANQTAGGKAESAKLVGSIASG